MADWRCADALVGGRATGVPPERTVIVEDAIAGVEAGRNGRFAVVIGVVRQGTHAALYTHGADVVLVNLPNWLYLMFRLEDGDWLDIREVEDPVVPADAAPQTRDALPYAAVSRQPGQRDHPRQSAPGAYGRSSSGGHRNDHHRGRTGRGASVVRSALDGRVINAGLLYRQLNGRHLKVLRSGSVDEDGLYLLVQTNQSHLQIAEAARTQVFCAGQRLNVRRHTVKEQGFIAQELRIRSDARRADHRRESRRPLYLPGSRHCGM